MSRMIIMILVVICALRANAQMYPAGINMIYNAVVEKVAVDCPIFGEPDKLVKIGGPEGSDDFGEYYECEGKIYIRINAETITLRSFLNRELVAAIRSGKYEQKSPVLNPSKAIEKARDYLRKFDLNIPADCVIRMVEFSDSRWHVEWEPTWGGYRQLDFETPKRLRLMSVTFHESMGICYIGNELSLPSPATFEVKLSREMAISKAERLACDVMLTPFYRMARMSGFVVNGIKSSELRIVKPNWLFDPKRAIWGLLRSNEIVKETRLCWVVTFTTIDTLAETRGKDDEGNTLKLKRPDILIFIDAATGECVGANFT